MQVVMGVLRSETAQHGAPHIRFTVAVGVLEMQQLGALRDVHSAVSNLEAGGDQESIRKNGRLVGVARAGRVLEHDDFVSGGLARLDLRIELRARNPETS